QVVHARPLDRLIRSKALAHQLEKRAGGKDLRVAVHAGSGRWDAGEGRILDRRVAVAAVDAVAGDVSFVAELDRLLARDARLGDPRRAVDLVEEAEQGRDDEDGAEDADAGKRVGGTVEDLRHCGSPNFSSLPCLPGVRDTHIVKYFTLWPRLQMGAVIFDLRQNGGGDPTMVAFITSYLFGPQPVHLNDFYSRPTNETRPSWTLPYVPGRRLTSKDVYVLTSSRTFSGAEEFTYNLKN